METFDYIVLGAGLGGLSAAACLSRQGHQVLVLEQHYLPGGCCHTFQFGDYHFCADVHYISQCGQQEVIGQFLDYIEREIAFNSLDPEGFDRVITPEVDFRIPLGWETFRQRMLSTFPEETTPINRYFDTIQCLHQEMETLNREVDWYDPRWHDWLKLPRYWNLFHKRNWTLQDLYDHLGLSPKLQALFAGQSGDYALPPSQIALITHTSLVWDYCQGAYYPRYHFGHFIDTVVEAITSRGGTLKLSTPVESIELRDGQVHSVTAAGAQYRARRAYISDLDPKLTVQLMQDPTQIEAQELERLTSYDYSASAFNIYLGLDQRFQPQNYGIGNWNIWYYPHANLNEAYEQQLRGQLEHPWIFMSCPTLKSTEPGIAPPGHHILEITTVCPYKMFHRLRLSDPQAYKAKKREVYQAVMASVQDLIPDINAFCRMKVYGTPTTSKYYLGQPEGNIYGAKLIPQQVGLNRIGYRTAWPNLFLVGATAGYPSVPGVINNGMAVVKLITGESLLQGSPHWFQHRSEVVHVGGSPNPAV